MLRKASVKKGRRMRWQEDEEVATPCNQSLSNTFTWPCSLPFPSSHPHFLLPGEWNCMWLPLPPSIRSIQAHIYLFCSIFSPSHSLPVPFLCLYHAHRLHFFLFLLLPISFPSSILSFHHSLSLSLIFILCPRLHNTSLLHIAVRHKSLGRWVTT